VQNKAIQVLSGSGQIQWVWHLPVTNQPDQRETLFSLGAAKGVLCLEKFSNCRIQKDSRLRFFSLSGLTRCLWFPIE
jgi:hypothetical protein